MEEKSERVRGRKKNRFESSSYRKLPILAVKLAVVQFNSIYVCTVHFISGLFVTDLI